MARPRGWHLAEAHLLIDGEPAVGALVDFGLHFFHIAKQLCDNGHGPYYYLPKMESHLEARLWNDVFTFAEDELGIPHGHHPRHGADRDHPGGLRDGGDPLRAARSRLRPERRTLGLPVQHHQVLPRRRPEFVLLDRADSRHDRTVHARLHRAAGQDLPPARRLRHGRHGRIHPQPREPEVNAAAFAKVRADKTREAGDGFDGSWVAHPDLVPICREVFDAVLGDKPNQLDRQRPEVEVTADQLLDVTSAQGQSPRPACAQPLRRRRVHRGLALRATAPWPSTT